MMLIVSIFLFVLLNCRNWISFLLFVIVLVIYHNRFKKIHPVGYLFMILVYGISFFNFSIFDYCIIESHENYAIASIDHQKVVLYTDEVYFEGDMVEYINEPKEISSCSNFSLFDFESYMKKQNIIHYYDQKDVMITKKDSLKRRLYEKIEDMDEQVSEYLKKYLYSFQNDDFMVSCGLHYSYIHSILLDALKKKLGNKKARILASMGVLLFGVLFPFRFALFRILVKNLIAILFEKKSSKEKFALSSCICMAFMPHCISLSAFTLPFLLNLVTFFCIHPKSKKILPKMLLMFYQSIMFNQIQWGSVLLFKQVRNIYGFILILSLMMLALPIQGIYLMFMKWIEQIFCFLSFFKIEGKCPFFLSVLFLVSFYMYWNGKKKYSWICVLLLMLIPLKAYLNPFYEVIFINVGQGDCILIRSPFNRNNILIDLPKNQEKRVRDFLKSEGIHQIDSLIFTHDDADHNGGKEPFLEMLSVKEVVEEPKDLNLYNFTLFSINENQEGKSDNDSSLVYTFQLGHLNYLLMGDASRKTERELIQKFSLECDILKVGHHGSNTSTDPIFLQTVQPKLAVISVGKNNRYGHPHDEVIESLEKYGVQIYKTSDDGAVSIKSFLNFNFITTSKGEFAIMIK